jgi:hypothetical protein
MECPITGKNVCNCTLKDKLRYLFTDHAVYTKMYIEAELDNLPDKNVIAKRLLQNQVDIGNSLNPIIGSSSSHEITRLLQEHILSAVGALDSLKYDKPDLEDKIKHVFENSSQVSKALSSLNPEKLPYDDVKKMFDEHNKHVLNIATLHKQSRYEDELVEYDKYYKHMMMLSDTLNDALNDKLSSSSNNNKNMTISFPLIFLLTLFILILVIYSGSSNTNLYY